MVFCEESPTTTIKNNKVLSLSYAVGLTLFVFAFFLSVLGSQGAVVAGFVFLVIAFIFVWTISVLYMFNNKFCRGVESCMGMSHNDPN
jgi:hypothetical protein